MNEIIRYNIKNIVSLIQGILFIDLDLLTFFFLILTKQIFIFKMMSRPNSTNE